MKKTLYFLSFVITANLAAQVPNFEALANQYAQQYPFEHQFFVTAASGDLYAVKNFIANYPYITHACNDFALVCAAHYGHNHIVQQLLAYGAYVNTYEGAPLCEAARKGHIAVIETLLRNKANIHASNDYALACACWNGQLSATEKLISWGAYIHADNDAALRWASLNGHSTIVKALLQHGANPRVNNYEPVRNAETNGHYYIADMLRGYDTWGSCYFWF